MDYSRGAIPDHDPIIGNVQGAVISIELGLDFGQVGIDNVMTHVFGLSIKIRRNERLWQTPDIGNMVGSNSSFKNSVVIAV